MKTLKNFLTEKGIEMTAFEAMTAEKQSELYNELNTVNEKAYTELAEKVEKGATNEDLNALKTELSNARTEQEKQLKETLRVQGLAVKNALANSEGTAVVKTLAVELKENKESIKAISKGGAGEIEIKALTNRASVANNAQGFFLPEITQLGHKERSLYNVLPKITVSDSNTGGAIRYRDWDEATTVRAAAMVAEGATFPESTAKFEWYSKDLKKVGDTLPVTEEFFEDEAQAAAELSMFLDINVGIVVDDQLVNGDNTGQNLDGIFNAAPAYTAVASGIAAPNLKDLVIKMRNDITRSRGSKYKPDMVLVNSLTMESLILAKDANNNYIFDETTGTLGGMFVVVDENVADNAIEVGDRRYARIYEKTGTTLTRGLVGTQFNEDELTIKARKRMLLLIKNGDKTGFRKVTDVAAALVTLAS